MEIPRFMPLIIFSTKIFGFHGEFGSFFLKVLILSDYAP